MDAYFLLLCCALLGNVAAPVATERNFSMIDFPGASSTQAWSINAAGDIVGFYAAAGITHGFLLSAGSFSSIDFPGASATFVYAINARGDIAGAYVSAGVMHGFLRQA